MRQTQFPVPLRDIPMKSDLGETTGTVDVQAAAPSWATLVATLFGIGRLKPGPGTWGSLTTVLAWWGLSRIVPPNTQVLACGVLALLVILIGIPAATRVARAAGLEDPQFVVIDEVAGQLITVLAVPVSWKSLLLGFILFRGFDMTKPPPARQLE